VRVNAFHVQAVCICALSAVLTIAGECTAQWDLNTEQPLVSAITPRIASLAKEQLDLSDSQLQSLNEIVATHAAKFAEFASAWRGKLRDLDKASVDPSLRGVEPWNLKGKAFRAGKEVADRQAAMDEGVLNQLRGTLTAEQSARWNAFFMRWLDARADGGSHSGITCEGRVQLLELLDQFAATTKKANPACSQILLDAAHAYANEACPIRVALISATVQMERERRDELEARARVGEDGTVSIGNFWNSSDEAKYSKCLKQIEKYSIQLGKLNVELYDRLERDLPASVFHDMAWSFWDKAYLSDVVVREAREWVRFYSLAKDLEPDAGEPMDAIEEVLAKGDKKLLRHLRIIATIANAHARLYQEPGESSELQAAKLQREVDALAVERQSVQQSAMVFFPESAQQKLSNVSAKQRDSTVPPK